MKHLYELHKISINQVKQVNGFLKKQICLLLIIHVNGTV